MSKIIPALKILEEGSQAPIGYQKITCHMIFDVKMDFSRKARFVAGGHRTEDPPFSTYASTVSRESVRIAFLMAALNNLDILMADIGNAYLNAPCMERVYFRGGKELGKYNGRYIIIKQALYGLKSSAAEWGNHMASTLETMNFSISLADNDV